MTKTYSVVIVNYNCAGFIEQCVSTVLDQSAKPAELIIVDSASTDGSAKVLAEYYPGHTLVFLSENKGFTAAANAGIAKASADFVLLMNADVALDRGYADEILKDPMIGTERAGIFTGKLVRMGTEGIIDSAGQFISRTLKPKERGYLEKDVNKYPGGQVFTACGAAGFYSKRMLEDIKEDGRYFDEDLFMYYEDMDLGFRANLRGWRAYYVPRARAAHERGGSVTRRTRFLANQYAYPGKPLFLRRLLVRNRYLVLLKDCPSGLVLMYLPFVLSYEFAFLVYLLIFDFKASYGIIEMFKLAGKFRQKRRRLMEGKAVSAAEYRKWII